MRLLLAMNAEDCFLALKNQDWFHEWSPSAIESAKKTIGENLGLLADCPYPGVAMISVWMNCEGVDGEGSYTRLVKSFSKGSHGFFRPTNIREVWTKGENGEPVVDLSFIFRGTEFSARMADLGVSVDAALLELINEAMTYCKFPVCFVLPNMDFEGDFGLVMVPQDMAGIMTVLGLFPPGENHEQDMASFKEDEDFMEKLLNNLDAENPNSLRELHDFAEETDDLGLFEEVWGSLPAHLVVFLRRDLEGFSAALADGADLNATSSNHALSALRIAIFDHFSEGMEFLLSAPGINLEQENEDGQTPLAWAIRRGFHDAAQRLIDAGANLHAIDHAGRGILELARESGHEELAPRLQALLDQS